MKRLIKRFTAAVIVSMVLIMTMGTCAFASSSAKSPHFDFACGSQFSMHPGETKEITWFCDREYDVYTTQSSNGKSCIATSGHAGNNTGTIYISSEEQSSRVVFYFYPKNCTDDYDTLIVDIVPNNFNTAAVSNIPGLSVSAQTTGGTHTLIYDAQGQPKAIFAIIGTKQFEQVSLGNFVATANGVYLTVNTPLNPKASTISMPAADVAAARALGINGLILNNKTVNWP